MARDHDVLLVYHATRERRVIIPPGLRTFRIGAITLFDRGTVASLRADRTIRHILESERPDLVHVSLPFSNLDMSLPELCHDLGIPIMATVHIPYGPPNTLWGSASKVVYRVYSNILNKYDALIVFSEGQRRVLASSGVKTRKIRVIPNGVDIDLYRPGPQDYKRDLGASVLVSYLGRVDPEKNVNILLESFDVLDLPSDHYLVVVGDGLELGRLRRQYNSNKQVIFRGFVRDEAERVRILRSSDIFVLPSAVEGLSIAMLEGMACGSAMIATDVGADGEAVAGAGIVLDLDSLETQLPLSLRLVMDYPDFREMLRAKARARAAERYSLNRNLDRLVELYRELTS
jgi:glycosyltransferase involved in cell wall biosynthesis